MCMATPIAARPTTAASNCLTKGLKKPVAPPMPPPTMLAEYTITRPPARSTRMTVKSTLSKASFLAIVLQRLNQLLEAAAAVREVGELVEAGAGRRQEDD